VSRLHALAAALGLLVVSALICAGTPLGVDYSNPSWIGTNSAGESVEALARLDFATAAERQPIMGGFSLLVRAPFVALAGLFGGGMLLEYRLGSLACLIPLAALAFVLARMVGGERPWAIRLLVVGLVLAAPTTFKSLFWGHPEEVLAAALAVGSILLARRHGLLAAALLGSAIATKQWAVLAAIPVVMAAPERRVRIVVAAAAVALLWMAPLAIGDLDRFIEQNRANGQAGVGVTPSSLWWPFGDVVNRSAGLRGGEVDVYSIPAWMTELSQPLTSAVVFGTSILFWIRRRSCGVADALALFALVMLLRCVLDPMTISYHHAPFYTALAAAEIQRTRRLPVLTLITAAVLVLTAELAPMPNLLNAVYLAWSLPLAAFLALTLFAPRLLGPLRVGPAPAR
jgi:hypothetical protein